MLSCLRCQIVVFRFMTSFHALNTFESYYGHLCVKNSRTAQTLSKSFKEKDGDIKGHKNEEKMPENTPNNIVTSLAEKAFLVASPVVPTKEDGEVDHERS